MARPIDFPVSLNKADSMRFVKELIRVESLPEDSEELQSRREFLSECREKARKVRCCF